MQLADGGVGCQMAAVGEEVGAVALGLDVGRHRVDGVLGHEVMHVEAAHLDVGIIGHQFRGHLSLGIEWYLCIAFQADAAVAFMCCQVGSVSGSVGLEGAAEGDALGNAVILSQLRIGHCQCEVDVLGCRIQREVCLEFVEAGQVARCSVESGVKGCGQADVKPRELHLLHIAVDRTLDAQRMVWVTLDETLWHIAQYLDDVLLTDLGIHTGFQLTGILVVEGVEVHIHLGVNVGVGCAQCHGGHLYIIKGGVQSETATQFLYLDPALLIHGAVPEGQREALWGEADGVSGHVDVCQADVVIVESLDGRLPTVVVVESSTMPVEAGHLIDPCIKVDKGAAAHGLSEADTHIECVAWQMEGQGRLAETEAVGIDTPFQGRLRGVHFGRVAQGDVETGI